MKKKGFMSNKKEQVVYNFYTKGEEIANAITHGVGAILSIIGSVFLIIAAANSGSNYAFVGVWVYSICLIILLSLIHI